MATFRDIAQAAGVSYGTVSNVMNGKGNVSSEKIKRVQETAARIGYAFNLDAQQLRKGKSNLLAVMIPNIGDVHYADFYTSFSNYAESEGYRVSLNVHNCIPQRERMLLQDIRGTKPAGTAVISCLTESSDPYLSAGFSPEELIFVEQRPFDGYDYIGFDFHRIGREMGKHAASYHRVALITEDAQSYVSREFTSGLTEETLSHPECRIEQYDKNSSIQGAALALKILSSSEAPEAIFTTDYSFAEVIDNVHKTFYADRPLDIYTTSHLFSMPVVNFSKYELNYRLLGKASAEQLIARIKGKAPAYFQNTILSGTGFHRWKPDPVKEQADLTMLTLDSPTANIMKHMASLYRTYTGINVDIKVFSYDGVHELLSTLDENSSFDIIRLDATWKSWFAPRIFEPLENLESDLDGLSGMFLPDMMERYGSFNGKYYALPETPSSQMLFYRRDLFEDTVIRRIYQEQMHEALHPPRSFSEFNRIASFFTRAINHQSPVRFGATLTLGNTATAATEFLTRYFALSHDLFDEHDHVLLNTEIGKQALREIVESSKCSLLSFSNWWRDTAREFSEGDTAMTILYSNYASEIVGKNSKVREQIGFSMIPGGNPLYGGGSIGISKYSKHKQQAYLFIRWLCGESISSTMTLLGSVSPCRATYNNYEIIDNYPWLAMTAECFKKTNAHRQPHDISQPFDERRFLEVLGLQVLNCINGCCSIDEALSNAERQYKAIGIQRG